MPALPADLISILEPCVKFQATHVEVSGDGLVLFKGEKELGRGGNPPGFLAYFTDVLLGLSHEIDGGHRQAEFHTPQGILSVTIQMAPQSIRLEFAPDSPAYIAQRFDELLDHAAREGAQQIAFTPQGVPMWKDGEVIGIGEIDAALMPAFIARARELANMKDGENTGSAFLIGNANMLLRIEIAERSGQLGVVVHLG